MSIPERRIEIHSKLDALLDEGFTSLAAIITQIHFEAFFRRNLPEGFSEAKTIARLNAEASRLLDAKITTEEEFEEAIFGDEAYFEVLESLVSSVLRGNHPDLPALDQLLCKHLREELRAAQ